MLFAIFDYIKYRSRKGAYSDLAIRADGGQLATKDIKPSPEELKTGDCILLHTTDFLLSWMVMYYTSSVCSHVAIVSENGCVIDATLSGVIEHPLRDYLDGRSYILIRRPVKELTDEGCRNMLAFGRGSIGNGYNWFGAIRMFLKTVFGLHANFRMCYCLDFLLLISPAVAARQYYPTVGNFCAFLAVFYVLIVVVSKPSRLASSDGQK